MNQTRTEPPTVAVVGGGLAGLAASCALSNTGFRVSLFERRSYLGGRASSYQHPGTGEVVDNCQHLLLGCCTNLIEFYRRIGVESKIRWFDQFTFLEPGGRASAIKPSFLPAPFHTAPAFLRASCLDMLDKLSIARAMLVLTPKLPSDTGEAFLTWLRRHGQTQAAIERFWKGLLVSALNEDLNRISIHYAAQVVRESFLKSVSAGRIGLPMVPLTELYEGGGEYIKARDGKVEFRSGVESFSPEPSLIKVSIGGKETSFDFAVLAVPFDALSRLLPQHSGAEKLRQELNHFQTSPITGIHLWFDRPITELNHAVLLDRTIQWMFHKSKLLGRNGGGSYIELVVSSSKNLVERSKTEIVELALSELGEFFPEARTAKLVKSTVIKEVHATFSPGPGVDLYRPRPETVWPRVFLAGDWVATGWPATMEGAVRSGYMAAEGVARASGLQDTKFMVPDLPASGFMRLFE